MKAESFQTFVLNQLRDLPELKCRRMFGGQGLYQAGKFFGILSDGRLFFRTDATTRPAFVGRGMGVFQPKPGQKLGRYYEVPAEVIEDAAQLNQWAHEAARTTRG